MRGIFRRLGGRCLGRRAARLRLIMERRRGQWEFLHEKQQVEPRDMVPGRPGQHPSVPSPRSLPSVHDGYGCSLGPTLAHTKSSSLSRQETNFNRRFFSISHTRSFPHPGPVLCCEVSLGIKTVTYLGRSLALRLNIEEAASTYQKGETGGNIFVCGVLAGMH